MPSQPTSKQKQAIFLKDRALEMVQRHGSTLQMPDYGIALECARPSFRICYVDPENVENVSGDKYHRLDIYAVGRGKQEAKRVKVFSARWESGAAPEVITFQRGPWEELFLSRERAP
jgi:hypothetical protein